jgi:hypothetical protein
MRRVAGWALAFVAGLLVCRYVDVDRSLAWAGDPELRCVERVPGNVSGLLDGDVNGDGQLDITDAVHVLNYLFTGGPPPEPRPQFPVKTVIFTRHAEKEGADTNAPLSPAGWERARVFGNLLSTVSADFLIASERDRTIDTLVPLAGILGKTRGEIEQIAEICDVVDRIDALPPGSTAVVAHHSFTLHHIFNELGVPDHEEITLSGSNFDNWIMVEFPVDASPELLHFKYPDVPEPPPDPDPDP